MFQTLRKMVDRFLQKIADQNQKQFGNQRMDCCQMNKPNTGKPPAATVRKPE